MPRARVDSLAARGQAALCMLAGGHMVKHAAKGWLDVVGEYHLSATIESLVGDGFVQRFKRGPHTYARLSERGRWYAASALAKAADILMAQATARRAERLREVMEADVA